VPDAGEAAGTVGETVDGTVPAVGDTVGTVGDTVGGTVPAVGDTVGTVGDTVGGTVPAVGDTVGGIADGVDAGQLVDQLTSQSLLDLDVDLAADLDAAAPISATVAANANVAAPINAAVSANILSPESVSIADADQAAIIQQTLIGEANAISNQVSDIGQGEVAQNSAPAPTDAGTTTPAPTDAGTTTPAPTDAGTTTPATTDAGTATPIATTEDGGGLLDLDVNADIALDVAAPINAAVAANANVAAPIDAAVSANIGSPGAVSAGLSEQDALVSQTLVGEANATSDQASSIVQGEEGDSEGEAAS
jgi:hypothetical protein